MQTITMRQRSFTGVWWSWWTLRTRHWQLRRPTRSGPEVCAPLPEQDPGAPIYHDAQLW
jgi:hypothetical protein